MSLGTPPRGFDSKRKALLLCAKLQGHPLTFSAVHDFHNAGVPVTMCSSRFPFSANSIEGFITFDGRAVRDGIGELHKIKKEGED